MYALAAASTVLAQPEATLDKCQQRAATEVGKYAAAVQKTARKCLSAISTARIKRAAGDAADAAMSCAAAFRNLVNTQDTTKTLAAKAQAKILKFCQPALSSPSHTVADVLGTGATVTGDAIQADDLGSWCVQFGGDGAVDTIQEWIDCQLAAAECGARQQLPAEYPNALAWLSDVRGDIQALGSDQKYLDAVTALDALDAALDGNGDDTFDLACGGAVPQCGNDAVDGPEQCDGSDLNGISCTTLGFDSGALTCTAGCAYDTSACVPISVSGGVLQTGVTTCYNAVGTVITCAGTGQDGELQQGTARSHTDNGDGTITDNGTGLMWEKLSDDGSIHDKDTTYNWTDAFAIKIAALNTASFAGHTDWRLPNLNELLSLVNYRPSSLLIDAVFFSSCSPSCAATTCSCTPFTAHWSSTTYYGTASVAYFVSFNAADPLSTSNKAALFSVRAVRGGS